MLFFICKCKKSLSSLLFCFLGTLSDLKHLLADLVGPRFLFYRRLCLNLSCLTTFSSGVLMLFIPLAISMLLLARFYLLPFFLYVHSILLSCFLHFIIIFSFWVLSLSVLFHTFGKIFIFAVTNSFCVLLA